MRIPPSVPFFVSVGTFVSIPYLTQVYLFKIHLSVSQQPYIVAGLRLPAGKKRQGYYIHLVLKFLMGEDGCKLMNKYKELQILSETKKIK